MPIISLILLRREAGLKGALSSPSWETPITPQHHRVFISRLGDITRHGIRFFILTNRRQEAEVRSQKTEKIATCGFREKQGNGVMEC
jgi:hypothetical protein